MCLCTPGRLLYRWQFIGRLPERFRDAQLVFDGVVDFDRCVDDVDGADDQAEDRSSNLEAWNVQRVADDGKFVGRQRDVVR